VSGLRACPRGRRTRKASSSHRYPVLEWTQHFGAAGLIPRPSCTAAKNRTPATKSDRSPIGLPTFDEGVATTDRTSRALYDTPTSTSQSFAPQLKGEGRRPGGADCAALLGISRRLGKWRSGPLSTWLPIHGREHGAVREVRDQRRSKRAQTSGVPEHPAVSHHDGHTVADEARALARRRRPHRTGGVCYASGNRPGISSSVGGQPGRGRRRLFAAMNHSSSMSRVKNVCPGTPG
jgi:hypothetical protein